MFWQPLNEIRIVDIEQFIDEQHREGEILDYKVDWPNDLAKVIASMANTQGGIVFIGVSEKEKSGLPDQLEGIQIQTSLDALRQKVISTAYSAIYPPIIPEVEAFELTNKTGYAVVVIRISVSEHTPHAVENRTKVYVRIDSQSQPYRLATINELQWLFDKRVKSEKYILDLIESANDRADQILSEGFDPMIDPLNNIFPTLKAWIAPRFRFGNEVFSQDDVQIQLATPDSSKSTFMNREWFFPDLHAYGRTRNKRSVPLGYCVYTPKEVQLENDFHEYSELNTFGVLFTKLRINRTEHDYFIIPIQAIISHLDALIKFACTTAKGSHLRGLLRINATLFTPTDTILDIPSRHSYLKREEQPLSLDYSINLLDKTINIIDFEQAREALIKEVANNLLWAFGYGWLEDFFERWWKELNR